jgi:tetratricopeptide (TPR) repeat protein
MMRDLFPRSLKTILVSLALLPICGCKPAAERQVHYRDRGAAYLKAKNYEKARIELANALQINPKDALARELAGEAAEALGDGPEALSNYLIAIVLQPTMTHARARLARLYVLTRNPAKAMELTEVGLKFAPDDPQLLVIRGAARAQQGDRAGALQDAETAAAAAPDDDFVVALLCSLYRQGGDIDKAILAAQRGVERMPSNAGLRVILADLLASAKRYDDAEAQLKQVIAIEPTVVADRSNLAEFYLRRGEPQAAEAALRDTVAAIPDSVQAKLDLVHFLSSQEADLERALAQARQYVDAEPANDELHLAVADYYQQLGRASDAEQLYRGVAAHARNDATDLAAHVRLATLRFAAGDTAQASQLVDQALEDYPTDPEALELRARLALWRGDVAGAMADLRLILRDQPANVRVMRLLATAHELHNEQSLSEDVLRTALQLEPGDVATRTALLQHLATNGKQDEALQLAQQLVADQPDEPQAVEQLFDLQIARKDYAAARATALKAQQQQPNSAMGPYLMGIANEAQGYSDAALASYERALQLQPDFAPPLTALVRLNLAARQPVRALQHLDAVIARNPQNPVARNLQGEVRLTQGQFADAIGAFEAAVRIQPSWWLPYRGLATAQTRLEQPQAAIATLQRGLIDTGGSAELAVNLSALFEQAGRIDEAIKVCDQLLERDPRSRIGVGNLAMLLATYRQDQPSLLRAQQLAAQLSSRDEPSALDTRGWVAYKTGAYAQAIDLLQRAVNQVPDSPLLRYRLGLAQWKAGDAAGARRNLEVAVKSGERFVGADEARAALDRIRNSG